MSRPAQRQLHGFQHILQHSDIRYPRAILYVPYDRRTDLHGNCPTAPVPRAPAPRSGERRPKKEAGVPACHLIWFSDGDYCFSAMLGLDEILGAQHTFKDWPWTRIWTFLLAQRIFSIFTHKNHTFESAFRVFFARLTTWIFSPIRWDFGKWLRDLFVDCFVAIWMGMGPMGVPACYSYLCRVARSFRIPDTRSRGTVVTSWALVFCMNDG